MIKQDVTKPNFKSQWRISSLGSNSEKKERQRSWHQKVRTGCKTCKQRKVRCDENKPECLRCRKAGFACGGYAPPKQWIFEASDSSSQPSSTSTAATSPAPAGSTTSEDLIRSPPPSGDAISTVELRALQFFSERTSHILATFAPSAGYFWKNIVPRLSQTNATVRSALIAVSSLHESKHYRQSEYASALSTHVHAKHYAKTISALTKKDRPPPPEVVLITCFIFIACENLKLVGTAPAELMHVQSGLKVLREWKAKAERRGSAAADSMLDVMENLLEPMFARLEAQTYIMQDVTATKATFNKYDLKWSAPTVPSIFTDLFEARDILHDILQYFWYRTQLAGAPLLAYDPAYKKIASLMTQWQNAYVASFPRRDDRDWPAWSAAAALQIHYKALRLSIDGEALDSSLFWDMHQEEVEWIIDNSEEIIDMGTNLSSEGWDSLWLYDFCLNPPLLVTGIFCRHPELRRKAIELSRTQHSGPDQSESSEKCWTAFIIEMIMSVEEMGLEDIETAEDIPEASRIRALGCHLGVPGQATVYYSRPPHTRKEQHTVKWEHWTKPAINSLSLYPFGHQVLHGNYQGLIRPLRKKCLCKSFGAPVPEAWEIPP